MIKFCDDSFFKDLGPGHTNWCWAGALLEKRLVRTRNPGRGGHLVRDPGPTWMAAPGGYGPDSRVLSFIMFCPSPRFDVFLPPRLPTSVSLLSATLPRHQLRAEYDGGSLGDRNWQWTARAPLWVSNSLIFFPLPGLLLPCACGCNFVSWVFGRSISGSWSQQPVTAPLSDWRPRKSNYLPSTLGWGRIEPQSCARRDHSAAGPCLANWLQPAYGGGVVALFVLWAPRCRGVRRNCHTAPTIFKLQSGAPPRTGGIGGSAHYGDRHGRFSGYNFSVVLGLELQPLHWGWHAVLPLRGCFCMWAFSPSR